jgi:hypothetical protein
MDDEPLKHQLPFPYNQDLSQVLRHLNRRTALGRARLANDPVTAAYIAAAMRLVRRHLGPGVERKRSDPDDDRAIDRPLLAFLSQRAVANEVANNPNPFPKMGSVSTMRTTWEKQSDFIADLLSFGLWSAQYPATQHDDTRAAGAEELVGGDDLVQAVHDLAYWDSSSVINLPSYRLGLIAALAAEGDEELSNVIAESYEGGLAPWRELYAEFLRARNLQLRHGITIDDLASLLAAFAEGVLLRALGDPTAEVIDHDQHRSLLGTAALAMIYSCTERAESATGRTLEQAVRAMLYDRPPADSSRGPHERPHPDGDAS